VLCKEDHRGEGDTGEMTEDALAAVRRWLDSGGEARLVSRHGDELVVGLFTCDGGEEMDRVVGPAAELGPLLTGE
jgi:hypothetical protein